MGLKKPLRARQPEAQDFKVKGQYAPKTINLKFGQFFEKSICSLERLNLNFLFFQKGASRRVSVTEINFVCGFGNMSFFS